MMEAFHIFGMVIQSILSLERRPIFIKSTLIVNRFSLKIFPHRFRFHSFLHAKGIAVEMEPSCKNDDVIVGKGSTLDRLFDSADTRMKM